LSSDLNNQIQSAIRRGNVGERIARLIFAAFEQNFLIKAAPDSLSRIAMVVLVKVSAAVGAVLGLADVAMHSCICSVTGVCTLADKATHSYICSVTSVCIYSVYKHVAPTFSDINQSTIDLLFCSTGWHSITASRSIKRWQWPLPCESF
jgi:hypothetical protein